MSEQEKMDQATETAEVEAPEAEAAEKQPKKKPRNKGKIAAVVIVIVIVVGVAGVGFWNWHNTPDFCSAFCHNMDQYTQTYYEPANTVGVDKYGNQVSNTNAMMATLHRANTSTGKSDFRCMDCHHPVIGQQISEGVAWVTGNYYSPLTEVTGSQLTSWEGTTSDQFCSNENCHTILNGASGKVDRDILERSTATMEFNPHSQHHNIQLECTDCHKGHRASVLVCTSCHQHENVTLPEGWVSGTESEELMSLTFLKS